MRKGLKFMGLIAASLISAACVFGEVKAAYNFDVYVGAETSWTHYAYTYGMPYYISGDKCASIGGSGTTTTTFYGKSVGIGLYGANYASGGYAAPSEFLICVHTLPTGISLDSGWFSKDKQDIYMYIGDEAKYSYVVYPNTGARDCDKAIQRLLNKGYDYNVISVSNNNNMVIAKGKQEGDTRIINYTAELPEKDTKSVEVEVHVRKKPVVSLSASSLVLATGIEEPEIITAALTNESTFSKYETTLKWETNSSDLAIIGDSTGKSVSLKAAKAGQYKLYCYAMDEVTAHTGHRNVLGVCNVTVVDDYAKISTDKGVDLNNKTQRLTERGLKVKVETSSYSTVKSVEYDTSIVKCVGNDDDTYTFTRKQPGKTKITFTTKYGVQGSFYLENYADSPKFDKLQFDTNTITWEESYGAVLYKLYRSEDEESGYEYIGTTIDCSYSDSTIKNDTYYYYKVIAIPYNTEYASSASACTTVYVKKPAAQPTQNNSSDNNNKTSANGGNVKGNTDSGNSNNNLSKSGTAVNTAKKSQNVVVIDTKLKEKGVSVKNGKLKKAKFKFKRSKNKKKITVTAKKQKAAVGFEFAISTNKKFKTSYATYSVSKNKYTFKKLNKTKKYFLRVRAFKVVNGKFAYGKWSKVVRAK
ncbi:MAG: hypothetical protein K6G88_11055 [Lachnospiraceae bacterium]|nr:hypothetical protein [Lachnospiraceae bacterium]